MMKAMRKLGVRAQCAMGQVRTKVNTFLYDEKGDTNFISILVLLGIALALAGVFLAFKDQIIDWVDKNIGNFFTQKAGRK